MTESPANSHDRSERSPARPGDRDTSMSPDPDDEAIDEIGEESFPASDSPSSWSGPPTEPR